MSRAPDFEHYLGRGWFNAETQNGGTWHWSRNHAEILIPQGARSIQLGYFSRFSEMTGKPQFIRAFVDGAPVAEFASKADSGVLTIPCPDGRRLAMEVDAIRPCHYPGYADTRVLGIALFELQTFKGRFLRRSMREFTPPAADLRRSVTPNRPPITIQVEVTAACHLECVMCARPAVLPGHSPHMSDEIWDRFFAYARHADNVSILGAGEPWLHPRFPDFVRQLDAAGVALRISTSGDLITEAHAKMLGELKHLRLVTFSIDSPEPTAYHRIRGQSLDRALAGLERTMRHLPDPSRVRIAATVMRDNLFSLAGFPELLRRYGVRKLNLRGVNDTKDTTRAMAPDYTPEERKTLLDIRRSAESDGVLVNFLPTLPPDLIQITTPDFRDEGIGTSLHDCAQSVNSDPARAVAMPAAGGPRTHVCYDPWEKAFVTKDGDIYPCEAYHLQKPLGSLASHSFEEIWRGSAYRDYRAKLLCGGNVGCKNCERRDEGEHLFNAFSARMEHAALCTGGISTIILRNTGLRPWGGDVAVRLGTCRPQDRIDSALAHESWLTPRRVCAHQEAIVPPGRTARFEFRTNPVPGSSRREHFQFVVENHCWLPNTEIVM